MTEIGPVHLLAVAFGPGTSFEGRVIDELVALEGKGTIRVLDLLFVLKDAETGELVALDHQGADLGAIVATLLGLDSGDDVAAMPNGGGTLEGAHAFGLSEEAIRGIGQSLEPGHSAGILLIEHLWARDLRRTLRDLGGEQIANGLVSAEALSSVAFELAAMAERSSRTWTEDTRGELDQLAQLRDQGIITAQDFDAQKKQLLGI